MQALLGDEGWDAGSTLALPLPGEDAAVRDTDAHVRIVANPEDLSTGRRGTQVVGRSSPSNRVCIQRIEGL